MVTRIGERRDARPLDDPRTRLAELIATAARHHGRASPPPRGVPFFGLDHRSGSATALLGALASHGIFRKYELVLDLSAHLGASSRWLATTLGCTAVATAATVAEATAAGALTRGARLGGHVHHVAADPSALPFTDAGFTNVWSVEALAFLPAAEAALAEAFRVLRPGGHLAVQEFVSQATRPRPDTHLRFAPTEAWTAMLRRRGFVDLTVRDMSAHARETVALLTTARARLESTLAVRARAEPALAPVAGERALLSASLANGTLGLVQLLARRP